MRAQSVLRRFSIWIFVACGIWLIGLGAYFMFARPPLLPEDLRNLGSSAIQVEVLLPRLASWLRNVFTVMGGFIAGCGVLTIFVSVRAVPQGEADPQARHQEDHHHREDEDRRAHHRVLTPIAVIPPRPRRPHVPRSGPAPRRSGCGSHARSAPQAAGTRRSPTCPAESTAASAW